MELGLVIACLILATISLLMSIITIVMIMARDRATHTVQLMPVDEEIDRANEEYMKEWASSDEGIKKQNDLHKEEIEASMPEFSLDEDDLEKFSI